MIVAINPENAPDGSFIYSYSIKPIVKELENVPIGTEKTSDPSGTMKVSEVTFRKALDNMNKIEVSKSKKTGKTETVEKIMKDLKLGSLWAASKSPINTLWYKYNKARDSVIGQAKITAITSRILRNTQSNKFGKLLIGHKLPYEKDKKAREALKWYYEKAIAAIKNAKDFELSTYIGTSKERPWYSKPTKAIIMPSTWKNVPNFFFRRKGDVSTLKSPVYRIIASGSDFLAQNFRVGILFSKTEDSSKMFNNSQKIEKMFYSRVSSVTVPQKKAKTFTLKTPTGQVEKVSSKFEGTHEATLTIRVDKELEMISKLNAIGYCDESDKNYSAGGKLVPYTAVELSSSLFSKNSRIDIIVNHTNDVFPNSSNGVRWNAGRKKIYNQESIGKRNNKIALANEPLPKEDAMAWVFEDVNFIGPSGGISFDRGGSGSQTVSYTFIYKRLVRITGGNI